MLKIETNPIVSFSQEKHEEIVSQHISKDIMEIKDSLVEELKESAELQVRSEASAMVVSSDSIC